MKRFSIVVLSFICAVQILLNRFRLLCPRSPIRKLMVGD